MNHKFAPGQTVQFGGGYPYGTAAQGHYQIIQQLPLSGGEFQYRIKSEREQHERVVKESELHSD